MLSTAENAEIAENDGRESGRQVVAVLCVLCGEQPPSTWNGTMTRQSPHPRLEDLRRKADRRNYLCNLADGAFALLAFNLISQDFVVPAFLRKA